MDCHKPHIAWYIPASVRDKPARLTHLPSSIQQASSILPKGRETATDLRRTEPRKSRNQNPDMTFHLNPGGSIGILTMVYINIL